jgi:hypothetical protein
MQDQVRDSLVAIEGIAYDSVILPKPLFLETRSYSSPGFRENLYSTNLTKDSIPDWYFIAILLVISGIAWARIGFGKFLNLVWISAYSYQIATKVYNEQSVVQKRFSLSLDLLYLINASLFLFLLNRYFAPVIFKTNDVVFVFQAFSGLSFLVLLRILVMRLTAYIFERSELFLGFLYHFFIFNKVLGMLLIPFLLAIPYTKGDVQEMLIYAGVSIVIMVYIFRLVRASVYVLKNVILLFYLILYLCILEILPLLVVFKLLLSLEKV